MRYDTTLKDLIWRGAPAFLRQVTGAAATRLSKTEYPETRARRPDVVGWLEDGRLFHLELQGTADPDMAARMLEYYGLVSAAHGGGPVYQCVLTLTDTVAARMPAGLSHPDLLYRYTVTSFESLDAKPLLDSPRADDNVLAILCRTTDIRDRARAILTRLCRLPDLSDADRRDAATRLLVLSGVRRAVETVLEEVTAMGIQIDIQDNEYLMGVFSQGHAQGLAEGHAEGHAEGLVNTLLRLSRRRFGAVSPAQEARIRAATPDQLNAWIDAILDAGSLDELFGDPHARDA